MKINNLPPCSNCGGTLEVNGNVATCKHCGSKSTLDDGATTHNYNHTYNHTYDHTYTKRDEARIRENESRERIRLHALAYENQQHKRDVIIKIFWITMISLAIIAVITSFVMRSAAYKRSIQEQIDQGKISAGYYADYEGEHYEAVVKQFEEMGFTNIVTIDLKDSGLAFWNNGEVKSISIDGNDSFVKDDYFHPDAKVIIKYH